MTKLRTYKTTIARAKAAKIAASKARSAKKKASREEVSANADRAKT
jgi:hypothetical protein